MLYVILIIYGVASANDQMVQWLERHIYILKIESDNDNNDNY